VDSTSADATGKDRGGPPGRSPLACRDVGLGRGLDEREHHDEAERDPDEGRRPRLDIDRAERLRTVGVIVMAVIAAMIVGRAVRADGRFARMWIRPVAHEGHPTLAR